MPTAARGVRLGGRRGGRASRRSCAPAPAPSRSRPRSAAGGRSTSVGSDHVRDGDRVVQRRAAEVGVGARGGSGRRSRAARPRPSPTRPARRAAPRRAASVTSAWCVTSRPIIVTSIPLSNTRRAASGSAQMLNSAAGVRLPSPIEPPISTIRSGRASGCSASRSATFVSGPVGTSVSAPSRARICPRQEVDRVLGDRRARRRRQVGPVEPGLAVDVRRDVARADERAAPRRRRPARRRGPRARAPAARSRSSSRASGCRRRS